jgi:hypothetical protein
MDCCGIPDNLDWRDLRRHLLVIRGKDGCEAKSQSALIWSLHIHRGIPQTFHPKPPVFFWPEGNKSAEIRLNGL